MRDWSDEFPGLTAGTYLNSCASGLMPQRTRARLETWMDGWRDDPDWNRWVEQANVARRAFARAINADEDEVALQASASTGISSVASALAPTAQRKAFVTTDIDFPTAPAIWTAQRARGFDVRSIDVSPGTLDVDTFAKRMTDDVMLASIPLVASFTGQKLDVKGMAQAAHDAGAYLMVDAFQAFGSMPVDVKALDCDFLVSGCYKWQLATPGIAFVYAKREVAETLTPTAFGWYGLDDPYAFDPNAARGSGARRFEYGGASIPGAVAAASGLEILQEVGLDRVDATNRALGDRIMTLADERGWPVLTPRDAAERSSIVVVRPPDLAASLAACEAHRVKVNTRLEAVRVSPHFYNTPAHVDRLFEVLDAAN